jgi:hypothetical protein
MVVLYFSNLNYALNEGDLYDKKIKIPKHSILTLIKGMSSDNMGLKVSCILTASENRIEESVETLIYLLMNSDEPDKIKLAVVFALYNIRTKDAISALKYATEADISPSVNIMASIFYYNLFRSNNITPVYKNYMVVE